MSRVSPSPIAPLAAAALLALASGCAAFAPAAPTAAAPADGLQASAASAPADSGPAAATTAAATAGDGMTAGTDAVGAVAARSASAGSPAPSAAAPRSASRSAQPARPRAADSARDTAPGPTVTTFVYSDAPTAVKREAAGADASRAVAARVPEGFNPYRIAYAPGAYRCELGRSVQVRTVSPDLKTTTLRWGRDEYTLRAVDARSGALRYEDPGSGLAWIVLRDRSMLLDMREGQRLANACRA